MLYILKTTAGRKWTPVRKFQNTGLIQKRVIKHLQQYFHTRVRQDAVALVPRDVIDAGPLVEAGVGGAFVDVGLAVRSWGRSRQLTTRTSGQTEVIDRQTDTDR